MRRALLVCASLAFALACSDNITEPIPERSAITQVTPPISFATTTTEDGLSISTDKDDYQPGDVVHFTGSGWQPGHVLDIVLTDDPLTHPPHTWTVTVGEDGTFRDATYVVDEGDLDVTFTLVATDALTGQSLTVVFTDANLQIRSGSNAPTPNPFSPNADGVKDAVSITVRNAGNGDVTNVFVRIRAGTGTVASSALVREFSLGTLAENTDGTVEWNGTNTGGSVVVDGAYTARIFSTTAAANQPENETQARKATLVVDKTSPTVTVNAIANGTTGVLMTITGTANDLPALADAGLEKVEVTIRRASDNGILATGLATNTGSNFSTWSFSYTPGEASAQKASAKATDNAGNHTTSADRTFTVVGPGPNHLAFTTSAFTGVVGQCLGPITVQTQNGSNAATNVTSNTTVSLGTDGAGAFYGSADATCTTPLSPAELTITTGQNSASFRYRATGRGDGTHELTASASGLASATQPQTINKATPTLSNLSSPTITFGDTPTTLSGEISAGSVIPTGNVSITVNGVTQQAAIGSDGKFSSSFATGSLGVAGSPYLINYSFAADDDFNSVGGIGALTVIKATPSFTNLSSPTITYGDTPTGLAGTISKGTLIPTGNVSVTLNGVTQEAAIGSSGNFSSNFATNALGVANSPYAISYSYDGDANFNSASGSGSLTVDPAPLTITADDKEKDYDGHAFTDFTVQYSGFVNSEGPSVLGGALSFGGTAVGAVNAGDYTIIPSGLTSVNYEIEFQNGTLTINKVLLTVTAVNREKVWDGLPYPFNTNPVTTTDVTYSGFVNSEGPSVLTGPLVFSAGAQVATGTYTNTPSGLTATNYNFNYVAGQLRIHAWTLTGFYQPVDMTAGGLMWNTVKGGSTVPLKFNVYQATTADPTKERTDVAAIQQPFTVTPITCAAGTADQIEFTTTGGTTLRYSVDDHQFIQNWQTPKSPGACYRTTMTTIDGSKIQAYFKLK